MSIKCIFFDFDGVLAESVHIKTEAFRTMYLSFGVEFSNRVVNHHIINGGISRYEKFKIYNGEWLGEKITSERIDELAKVFSNLVVDGVVNSLEVSGASEFLKSSDKFKKYIITGTPTVEIKPILQRRKMDMYFDEIYGSPTKKGVWVNEILINEQLSPNECVFIGDALADLEAAEMNKVPFILRETKDAEKLFENFKGLRIRNLDNLHQIIDVLNKKLA